jgi:hypothetical protein
MGYCNFKACLLVRSFTLVPNRSIERPPYDTLRVPPVAAHVER